MFIQIQDGISVNADLIEAVYKKDDNSCEVYVGTRKYEATYPYDTFMSMLNAEKAITQGTTPEEKAAATKNKLMDQFWAG